MFIFTRPLCFLAGFVYPAYKSFAALREPEAEANVQWLTYWVLYSLFSQVEYLLADVFFWLPLYYELKLALILWLHLPYFSGATWLYGAHIAPFLQAHQGTIDAQMAWLSERTKNFSLQDAKKAVDWVALQLNQSKPAAAPAPAPAEAAAP